ncbi:MAG: hypothetical protein II059_07175 [Clostridia bacterium]|nr:hypothetical protein [Clostridia bacterium]
MKIYDKASWHIDAGMDEHEVVEKFRSVFNSLERLDLLSDEGYEISELGIDDSISLNENMVTKRGCKFLDKYYDAVIAYNSDKISDELEKCYKSFALENNLKSN